jgi:hypothetical protein
MMAVEGDGGISQAEELHRHLFGRIGVKQAQRVLAALLEAPFFYKSDDPDLFGVLYRNRNAFADFFHVCFDWELHVEPRMARVIRPSGANSALSPRERHLFSLNGRDEQVLFTHALDQFPDAPSDSLVRRQVPLRILTLGAESLVQAQASADRNQVQPLNVVCAFHVEASWRIRNFHYLC